jgi:hypothetical protein
MLNLKRKLALSLGVAAITFGGANASAAEKVIVGGMSTGGEAFIGQINKDNTMQELYFSDDKNKINGLAYSKKCNIAVAVGSNGIELYDFNKQEGEKAVVYLSARLWDVEAATVNGKPIFIAVGDSANIVSSPDCGKTWKQAIPYTEEYKKGGTENIQKYHAASKALVAKLGGNIAFGFTHFRGVEFVEDGKGGGNFIATGSFDSATTFKLDKDNFARFESFTKHANGNTDQAKDIISIGDGKYLITGKNSYKCDASNKCKTSRSL